MILIIGYGFLGSAIYSALKEKNYEVKVLSRSFHTDVNSDLIKADLAEIPEFLERFPQISTIIHCVHTTVPATSMDDAVFDVESNVISFINLMKKCQDRSIENFIYISSGGAVYGNPTLNSVLDETSSTNPISSYGITKLICEKYLLINSKHFSGNCVILRPSNIYGIGQKTNKPQGLVGHINESIINSKTLEIWGDGNSKKDYLFIGDFVNGILKVISFPSKINEPIYNVSSGNLYSINYLINSFEKKHHRKINVVYKTEKSFDVKDIALSNKRFSETFNWKNSINFEDFLEQL